MKDNQIHPEKPWPEPPRPKFDVPPVETCNWVQDWDGNWETQCTRTFCFDGGDPEEHGYNFCPTCGKIIILEPYHYLEDDDDDMG